MQSYTTYSTQHRFDKLKLNAHLIPHVKNQNSTSIKHENSTTKKLDISYIYTASTRHIRIVHVTNRTRIRNAALLQLDTLELYTHQTKHGKTLHRSCSSKDEFHVK